MFVFRSRAHSLIRHERGGEGGRAKLYHRTAVRFDLSTSTYRAGLNLVGLRGT
jgi:hypothetical protein